MFRFSERRRDWVLCICKLVHSGLALDAGGGFYYTTTPDNVISNRGGRESPKAIYQSTRQDFLNAVYTFYKKQSYIRNVLRSQVSKGLNLCFGLCIHTKYKIISMFSHSTVHPSYCECILNEVKLFLHTHTHAHTHTHPKSLPLWARWTHKSAGVEPLHVCMSKNTTSSLTLTKDALFRHPTEWLNLNQGQASVSVCACVCPICITG